MIQGISLPVDIPWKRLCASTDMMDKVVCDRKFPYRWRSSIATFYYEPPADQQTVTDMIVAYLKISCSITGYQISDKEIGIDKRRLDSSWNSSGPIDVLDTLVETYFPCYGAILEVAIAPQGGDFIFPDDYPYFSDFDPKKRELYEMVTDTGEQMSRTLEELNVRKGMTDTQSHEVYDETTLGVKASAGAGGVAATGSFESKSGTKDISQQEKSNVNTTDNARDVRENFSHTTNFTQMYSQFTSYHLGTNRAVFFMLPRPRIVQAEENTFVQGPRELEGIQEVFLVVMRSSKMPHINVEAYLETAHIHELKEVVMTSPTPNDQSYHLDPNDKTRVLPNEKVNIGWQLLAGTDLISEGDSIDATPYQKDFIYTPPPGVLIATDYVKDGPGYEIIRSTSGALVQGRGIKEFNLIASTPTLLQFQGTILQLPQNEDPPQYTYFGNAGDTDPVMDVNLRIYTRSKDTVPQIFTKEKTMYLTGRGVCCGTLKRRSSSPGGPSTPTGSAVPVGKGVQESVTWEGTMPTSPTNIRASISSRSNSGMTIREANLIRNSVGSMMVNSINSNKRYEFGKIGLLDTQFVSKTIANIIKYKEHPDNTPIKQLPHHSFKGISKINKISPRITKSKLLQMTIHDQMTKYDLDYREVVEIRRALLGISGGGEPTTEVEVPHLVGTQIDNALNVIRKAKLSIGDSAYQDDFKPRGTVISQHPDPRTSVPVNSDIYLVVSSGMSLQIPDIIGKRLEYGLTILHTSGLKSEPVITFSSNDKYPRNIISKVTPSVGVSVLPETEITLDVSSGQVKHHVTSK